MTSFRDRETVLFPTLNRQDFVHFLLLNMVWIIRICNVPDPQNCGYGSVTGIEGPEPQ
jgi:hypothetical protein